MTIIQIMRITNVTIVAGYRLLTFPRSDAIACDSHALPSGPPLGLHNLAQRVFAVVRYLRVITSAPCAAMPRRCHRLRADLHPVL